MTTGTIILPIGGATLPDGSTSNNAAQFQRTKSSASAPVYHFIELLYDASTEESAYWSFRMPENYASAPIAKLQWKANATANSVVWGVQVAAITPGDTDTPNEHALATTYTAPAKPREGMVRHASGAPYWNPGSGRGVYCYSNAAWRFLG